MSDLAARRAWMVSHDLAGRDITDARVLDAMGRVPREEFVPPHARASAYADTPLPIGLGQTISQPYIVALTAQLARLGPTDTVMDIGTGCGYAAAVYSLLAARVISVELEPQLATTAAATLRRLGYGVETHQGDASTWLPDAGPFDAILAAAASAQVPPHWLEALGPGGRIVAPLGGRGQQTLTVLEKDSIGRWSRHRHGAVRFVPLRGGNG